jgi:hypothetical protein
VDPYSFDFMVKDRIRELAAEVAGQQRLANGKKRHVKTWLTAIVHLWTPTMTEPAVSEQCCEEDEREQNVSA